MHAESGAKTQQNEQSRGPARHKSNEDRRATKDVDGDRTPHRDLRRKNIEARHILHGAGRVAQLVHAIPEKQAAHQKPREHRQIVFGRVCCRGRGGRSGRMHTRCHRESPAVLPPDSGATLRYPPEVRYSLWLSVFATPARSVSKLKLITML